MLPPPPGLLLTVSEVGSRRFSVRIFSTVRPVLSLLPPAAEPTTISMFFCGDHVCAWAQQMAQRKVAPAANLIIRMLMRPTLF